MRAPYLKNLRLAGPPKRLANLHVGAIGEPAGALGGGLSRAWSLERCREPGAVRRPRPDVRRSTGNLASLAATSSGGNVVRSTGSMTSPVAARRSTTMRARYLTG
ncbi:MAG: hypothetical protein R2749_00280 [Acidimicrobiales bacterium]